MGASFIVDLHDQESHSKKLATFIRFNLFSEVLGTNVGGTSSAGGCSYSLSV